MIINGTGLAEFSAPSIVIIIAPLLVPTILYGCQSERVKELEFILLMIGNCICFAHGVNAARTWLLEIDANIIGMVNYGLPLYPLMFVFLCFAAIIQNYYNNIGVENNDY